MSRLAPTVLWQHDSLPLQLQSTPLGISQALIDASACELEGLIDSLSDGLSKTWGYFPEQEPDPAAYPATIALTQAFTEAQRLEQEQLAFVRRATGEPKSDHGGLHVDVSVGVSLTTTFAHQGREIVRRLYNLSSVTERVVEYSEQTTAGLAERGVSIRRDSYEPITLPDDIPVLSCAIPKVSNGRVHGLVFGSSLIPHAGRTNETGHFLMSYGIYATLDQVERYFL